MLGYYCDHCKVVLSRGQLIEKMETDVCEFWGAPVVQQHIELCCPDCMGEVEDQPSCNECGEQPAAVGKNTCITCAEIIAYIEDYPVHARMNRKTETFVYRTEKSAEEKKVGALSTLLKLSGMFMLSHLFGKK